jgi:hypothetical protein
MNDVPVSSPLVGSSPPVTIRESVMFHVGALDEFVDAMR